MITGSQRHLFEIPEGITYLNCAYLSPSLRSVTRAGEEGVGRKTRPWEISTDDFFDESERLRELFATIIEGDADGVAIIPSVSFGVGTAAANIPVRSGQTIVVLHEQFPSNVYPWLEVAERFGAEIVTVPRPIDYDWTNAVLGAIDERCAVVALPQGHWTDGSLVDLQAVAGVAHSVGAALVVDATQSLGAHPFSVAEIQPDFVISAAYKWLLGPYSLGYLWAAPEWRQGRPLDLNWMAREDSRDFAGLVDYRDGYQPGARRYDIGERSNFALTPMAIAALEQVLDWTVAGIAGHGAELSDLVERRAASLGLMAVPGKRRVSCLTGVRFPQGVPDALAADLAASGVYVSVRGDSIRISSHVFNDAADIDRLFDELGGRLRLG